MDKLDIVLLMSVNPGFGGQKFIASTLPKLREVRRRIDAWRANGGQDIWLEVDGGVKVDNIAEVARGRGRHLRRGVGGVRRARCRWGLSRRVRPFSASARAVLTGVAAASVHRAPPRRSRSRSSVFSTLP